MNLFGRVFASEVIDCVIDRIIIVHEGSENRELDPMKSHDQYLLLKNMNADPSLAMVKSPDTDSFNFAV